MFPPRTFIPPLGPPKRTQRERVLAAWRGIDLSAVEKERANRTRSTEAVIPRVLSGLRIESRRSEAEVAKV